MLSPSKTTTDPIKPFMTAPELNFEEAREHLLATSCTDENNEWRPINRMSIEDFGVYGTGVRLYFELLRALALVFGVITIFTLPLLIFNLCGSIITDGQSNYRWERSKF